MRSSIATLWNLIDEVVDKESAEKLVEQLHIVSAEVDAGDKVLRRLETAVVEVAHQWRIEGWRPDETWLKWIPPAVSDACAFLYSPAEFVRTRNQGRLK